MKTNNKTKATLALLFIALLSLMILPGANALLLASGSITGNPSGALSSSVSANSTFYITIHLSGVNNLTSFPPEGAPTIIDISASNDGGDAVDLIIASNAIILGVSQNSGEETYMTPYSFSVAGNELIAVKVDGGGNITLSINGAQVFTDILTATWTGSLVNYNVLARGVAGNSTFWITTDGVLPTPPPPPPTTGELNLVFVKLIILLGFGVAVLFDFRSYADPKQNKHLKDLIFSLFLLGAFIGIIATLFI